MSKPPPSSTNGSAPAATYELLQAQSQTTSLSDPISWSTSKSYRRSPYRHLHHQSGTIGTFTVRLLEGRNLIRSHWSVLGMGPVRHLGLSRAHGEVSSFVEFGLRWDDSNDNDYRARATNSNEQDVMVDNDDGDAGAFATSASDGSDTLPIISEVNSAESSMEMAQNIDDMNMMEDCKPAAAAAASMPLHEPDLMSMSLRDAAAMHAQTSVNFVEDDRKPAAKPLEEEVAVESMHDLDAEAVSGSNNPNSSSSNVHRSSTVHQNSNPIWPTSQRDGNRSLFAIRLPKKKKHNSNNNQSGGGGNSDGQRIKLRITVKEEMTGIEHVLPDPFGLGLTKGGSGSSKDGTIGIGEVDVTDLALGEIENCVIDAWTTLTLPMEDSGGNGFAAAASAAASSSATSSSNGHATSSSAKCTGRVRVLVSYEPYGMSPRRGDVAALESFARRNPSRSSCRPIIPPLAPLRVLDVIGSYCLVEYDFPSPDVGTLTSRDRKKQYAQGDSGSSSDHHHRDNNSNGKGRKIGTARIHRNAIFVIERTNAVDSAVNLALTPVDAVLSTPFGQATSQIAAPLIGAAGELVAPAMLTGRIMLASVNTVGAVGLSGAGAVVSSVAKSLDPNKSEFDDNDPMGKM